MMRLPLLYVSAAALVAIVLPSTSTAQQAPDAAPVVIVATATAERMAPTVTVPGSVMSRNDAQIAAEVDGHVIWVADVGTAIPAGGVVARIDVKLLQIEADRTASEVKRLQARLTFLESDEARQEALIAKGIAPRQKLDQSKSDRDMARQDIAEAKLAADKAQYDLAHSQITSPFPGRVAARLIQPGEYVERGKAVARVVDVGALDVSAQIPVASVAGLKEGDHLVIDGPNGDHRDATVRALVPVGDQVSRAAEIRADVSGASWLVGTAVKVETPTETPHAVVAVPRDAVLLRPDGAAIFRIAAGDVAELVPVKTGLSSGDRVEILGGIQPGDRVVVRGGETLQPGQKVQIQADGGPNAGMPARAG